MKMFFGKKIDGWNHHIEDKIEGQNEIQKPHPSIEKIK
jgi:hypothetical protein